jgi:glycerol-1-phosphate dehydrogenase [NAD(P)+]
MPLLARMLNAPLFIDVRPGAVASLATLLADRRISASGQVAVVVGRGQGEAVLARLDDTLGHGSTFVVDAGTVEAAADLVTRIGSSMYDAIVGIGGGQTLDVTKWAATRLGLPMVAVATNLAHDGIASPVSSLSHEGGKGSYGVTPPAAVIVDLDYVRSAPEPMVRAGVGDVVSNLTAIADWQLAHDVRDEPVDGFAIALGRTAAESLLHRPDGIESERFLTALAEALVLSAMAMVAAGSSRPCSGADHEILHAIEHLHPGTSNHGELAGVGALFAAFLREDRELFTAINRCLQRHSLPRTPADLGLTEEEFVAAVLYAPRTRPDRYTILEHVDLSNAEAAKAVRSFVSQARLRTP